MAITWRTRSMSDAVTAQAQRWADDELMARMWRMDPTVWSSEPVPEIEDRLGWLTLPETSRDLIPLIEGLHGDAIDAGITHVVLLGMGGSSLAPEVFASSLSRPTSPTLVVLDSTHPDAVAGVTAETDPATTWYVVASKSGTTLETMSFFHWFWAQAAESLDAPGEHFIAITDPGTPLDAIADERSFRASISADPTVGGRFSALTAFGLVPAGLIGADTRSLLDSAAHAAALCGPDVPLEDNPAFRLAALMATEAAVGNDKAHIIASDPVHDLPIWVEQLIAESTGKDGKGIVPVDGGPYPSRAIDGVVVAVGSDTPTAADFTLNVEDANDIAAAMFVFEAATAIAGEMLGIHPFNQPDVQLAKKLASAAMAGGLDTPATAPIDVASPDVTATLRRLFGGRTASYVSLQAYLAPTPETAARIGELRTIIDSTLGVYTTAGFGPRFLHSTGQIHKGGPAGGIYLQILDEPSVELPVPESDFTFNQLIAAQAEGDRSALEANGRDVLAVRLGTATGTGLDQLVNAIRAALT